MDNDLYSFAEIAHEQQIAPDIMFAWQGGEVLRDTIGGEEAEECPIEPEEAKAPLHIDIFEKKGSRI